MSFYLQGTSPAFPSPPVEGNLNAGYLKRPCFQRSESFRAPFLKELTSLQDLDSLSLRGILLERVDRGFVCCGGTQEPPLVPFFFGTFLGPRAGSALSGLKGILSWEGA